MSVSIDLAISKTHKFGSRESGDTAELVERPGGGLSVVIVDGQGSGAAAKRLSLLVAGRTVAMLNEGVRDGAAARASHDFLFALRGGQVSAALDIVSVDRASDTILFTRNSEVPMLLRRNTEFELIGDSGGRIGLYRHTRPSVLEFPACAGLLAILVTDGVVSAGERSGARFDVMAAARSAVTASRTASQIADSVLAAAIDADRGYPLDDMSVVVLQLGQAVSAQPIRRMTVSLPRSG